MESAVVPSVNAMAVADSPFVDLAALHELCRLRSTLEGFAAVRLRDHPRRETVLEDFSQRLEKMQAWARQGRLPEFRQEDAELHRSLVASCASEALMHCWEHVNARLEAWIQHVQEVYWPSLMTLYREHEFLIQAWSSDEPWVAEAATHQHLEAGWFRVAAARGESSPVMDPVERATSFLCTHYASAVEVGWLAQNVSFVSASHLTRCFRQKLGVSPYAFLRQVRMERAAQLLKTSADAVAVIALKTGYKNVSHFVRDFREKYVMTPKRYRDG